MTIGMAREYLELTASEWEVMEPERTMCFVAIGPPEVHGPHLPLGTDIFVAEDLRDRYIEGFLERYPGYGAVVLPTVPIGADALPMRGSLEVPARDLEKFLVAWGRGLSRAGFRHLVVADNHGGPRHLLAAEAASRTLWRRHRFALLNPFVEEFRRMLDLDEGLLDSVQMGAGRVGDLSDLHAGTNETSLALASGRIRPAQDYTALPRRETPPPGRIVGGVASLLRFLGAWGPSAEVRRLGSVMAWASAEGPGYVGAPGEASPEAGERMMAYRVGVAAEMIDRVLAGESPGARPPLWSLRLLRYLP